MSESQFSYPFSSTATVYELLLTATTPVSHHDPATANDSNRLLFNRQKQILAMDAPDDGGVLSQAMLDAICAQHPVPIDVADIVRDLMFPEFVATALTRLFLDAYNRMDGVGLFEGMERYERLETRLHLAAVYAHSLRAWWDRLTETLQVPIHGGEIDEPLLTLLSLPRGTQRAVLQAMVGDYRSIVSVARLWHSVMKLQSETYAEKAGLQAMVQPLQHMHYDAATLPPALAAHIVDVPAVSGNSLRHQVVREPAWLHLCQHLGLSAADPGQGPVPPGVEAIFYNGGNIEAGAKQPSNVFALVQLIRRGFGIKSQQKSHFKESMGIRYGYPSLDLLGGVTNSFDLGESRLRIAGWIVCKENREALRGSPAYDLPNAQLSVFDMVDDVTLTRQAGRLGLGQMIYSFETLCTGVQVLTRLTLSPYTPDLTRGALVAAVETFLAHDNTIGGMARVGFGAMRGEWLAEPEAVCREQYEAYLAENKDALVAGLCDGTLGTGQTVLS